MDKIDDNYPQFIKIDESRKEMMLELLETASSIFYKRTQGDVYLISMALGFKNKVREKSKKTTDVRTYHGLPYEGKLLIRSIILSTENFDYDFLKDGAQTLKIAEEYANAGMTLLYDKIFRSGTDYTIEDELWNQLKEISSKTS